MGILKDFYKASECSVVPQPRVFVSFGEFVGLKVRVHLSLIVIKYLLF